MTVIHKLTYIQGSTASGKTKLAMALAVNNCCIFDDTRKWTKKAIREAIAEYGMAIITGYEPWEDGTFVPQFEINTSNRLQ